ncbi:MAG: hypothetical protein CMM01_20405 [Rhodopirellula sp.]|nr:hypothetical protein [Rhodopirellula sp.]
MAPLPTLYRRYSLEASFLQEFLFNFKKRQFVEMILNEIKVEATILTLCNRAFTVIAYSVMSLGSQRLLIELDSG